MVNRTCGVREAGKSVSTAGRIWVRRRGKRREEEEERRGRRRRRKGKERTRRSGSGVELETTVSGNLGVMDHDDDFRPDLEAIGVLRVEYAWEEDARPLTVVQGTRLGCSLQSFQRRQTS